MSLGLTLARNAGTGGFLVSVPSHAPSLNPILLWDACGQHLAPGSHLGVHCQRVLSAQPHCVAVPPRSFLLLQILGTTTAQNVLEGGVRGAESACLGRALLSVEKGSSLLLILQGGLGTSVFNSPAPC